VASRFDDILWRSRRISFTHCVLLGERLVLWGEQNSSFARHLFVSDVNKPAIALALIIIASVSALTASFAYLVSVSQPSQVSHFPTASSTTPASSPSLITSTQENDSSAMPSSPTIPSASASSSSSPTSTATSATPAPTPLDDASYPEGIGEWIPFGNVGMISPTNQTYNTNNLTINVIGIIIVGSPYLSYSLDGGPRQPIAIELKKPEGLEVTIQRQIFGSVALPPLANGAHVIVLFADLGFDSRKSKETIYFDVEAR
jgi:hypothetical protein